MSSNNKSIDSYLESARKFKSPISTENVRSLIEMSELKKTDQISFFAKKGVKVMAFTSVFISTLVFLALNFNIFQNISQKTDLKESSSNNLQASNNKDYANSIKSKYNEINKEMNEKDSNNNSSNNSNNDNNPKKTYIMSNEEFEKHPELKKFINTNNSKDSINSQNNKPYIFLEGGGKSVKLSNAEYTKLRELNPTGKLNHKITGMNSIKLSEKEYEELGIKFDSIDINGVYEPAIGYWEQQTSKAASFTKFAKKRSTHKNEKLPTELKIDYLKLKPSLITDFDGMKRLYSIYPVTKTAGVEEFIIFSKSLKDLYKLDFNEDFIPSEIPDGVINHLKDLQISASYYQEKTVENDKLGNLIDNKLKYVYDYFYSISKADSIEQKLFQLTEKDTNFSQVMVMFSDKKPDSSENAYMEDMAKMGIKVVFTKHRVTMKEYLKQNYPELETQLTSFNKQIDSYIMINKMVAVEIPYKNDPNNNGLIFWYYPSQDLIDALPERYRVNLAKEFKLLANEDAICGSKPDTEQPFLDIWRACSGAIENLRVFPNPVKDNLTIRFDLSEERNISVAIYDLKGIKVKTLSKEQGTIAGKYSFTFDISEITKGMYFIVVSSFAGENAVQRIIKE